MPRKARICLISALLVCLCLLAVFSALAGFLRGALVLWLWMLWANA